MRKNLQLLVLVISGILLFSCEYDDTYIRDEIDKIKTDLSELKKQTSAIQSLVDALNEGKVISNTELLADNKGYKITFNDGTKIEIFNGETAPVIGVKEEDDVYYWTITTNGITDFLTDDKGYKLPVTGNAPELSIDADGYWIMNNIRIKDANGKEVKAQGDSFFTNIVEDDNTVTFVMADGKTIVIPKSGGTYLSFDNPNNEPFFLFNPGVRKDLRFSFANVTDLEIVSKPEGWTADIHLPNKAVNVLAPSTTDFGIGEIKIQGIDIKGLVYQAIVKVGIEGKIFGDPKGTFILNEGNMTTENGSLIFLTAEGNIMNKVYYNANGTELGNASQDLFINNGKMYIISQNGNNNSAATGKRNDGMLVIADAETLKREKAYNEEISKLSWPSHIAVLNEENIFIRDNNGVHIFNSVSGELKLIDGTKGAAKNDMAVVNGKVYVISGKKILVLEANNHNITKQVELEANISGLLRSVDENLWVSTTGKPHKISKVDSETLGVIQSNEITIGGLSAGWGSTPGITAKGDTIYYNNGATTIFRHIFSQNASKQMINVKEVVTDAGMVYNNIAVHPVTGDVYMNTIKGYGWDFTINNISLFEDKGDEMSLKLNHKDFTRFPAGIFFLASFR